MLVFRVLIAALVVVALIVAPFWFDYFRIFEDSPPSEEVPRGETSQESPPPAPLPPAEPTSEAKISNQLMLEKQRLEKLRDTLNEVRQTPVQPPTGSIDGHIQNLTSRIAVLEQQLVELSGESEAVLQNARVYRQNELVQHNQAQLDLQRQIENLSARIANLRSQPNSQTNPDLRQQILSLRAQRQLLRSRLQTLTLEEERRMNAIRRQQYFDQMQVRADRVDVERQLADLRANLSYWKSQRSATAQGPSLKRQRIGELEEEIQEQEQLVQSLQSLL